MNKITINGMLRHGLKGLLLLMFFVYGNTHAQETYTTIRKNVNPLAFDLDHELSSTQDSLLLDNKYLFKRVRFISDTAEKVFDFKPAVKQAKIPLDELPLGEYTVMFYQADKIIVFQIDRVLPFDVFDGLEGDLALNDADVASSEIESVSLDVEASQEVIAAVQKEENFEAETDHFIRPYNLTNLDRDHVQTRAEYRRNNLRPNGKPYND